MMKSKVWKNALLAVACSAILVGCGSDGESNDADSNAFQEATPINKQPAEKRKNVLVRQTLEDRIEEALDRGDYMKAANLVLKENSKDPVEAKQNYDWVLGEIIRSDGPEANRAYNYMARAYEMRR